MVCCLSLPQQPALIGNTTCIMSFSVSIQVIASGAECTAPSLLIKCCKVTGGGAVPLQQILINASECTTRILSEHRIKYSTLDSILCTRIQPEYVAGLPSLLFSLSTAGASDLVIHGPTGITDFITATQSYVKRKYPEVSVIEGAGVTSCTVGADYAHFGGPKIAALSSPPFPSPPLLSSPLLSSPALSSPALSSLSPSSSLPSARFLWMLPSLRLSGPPTAQNYGGVRITAVPVRLPRAATKGAGATWKDDAEIELEDFDDATTAADDTMPCSWTCYVIDVRGPVAVERESPPPSESPSSDSSDDDTSSACSEEDLPPRKRPRKTAAAEGVSNSEGFARVSSVVMSHRLVVVDCPTARDDHITATVSALKAAGSSGFNAEHTTVLHIAELPIYASAAYCAVLSVFGSEAAHVCVQRSLGGPEGVLRSHFPTLIKNMLLLQTAAPVLFPIHINTSQDAFPAVGALDLGATVALLGRCVEGSTSHEIRIGATGSVATHKASPPSVTLLGTGAAAPSVRRSCSSVLVTFGRPEGAGRCTQGMLIDIGEGAASRIETTYDSEGAKCQFKDIHWIWVSHMHADHHTGLLLLAWKRARQLYEGGAKTDNAPVLVAGPYALQTLLQLFNQLMASAWNLAFDTLACDAFPSGFVRSCDTPTLCASINAAVGGTHQLHLRQIAVDHNCREAFGLTVEIFNKKRNEVCVLGYSGDTRPCAAVSRAMQSAIHEASARSKLEVALLIHEATFDDDRPDDAVKKKHSTVSEALQVAADALALPQTESKTPVGAVLTHFSQRYPSIPSSAMESCASHDIGVLFGFDGMSFPLCAEDIRHIFANSAEIHKRMDEVMGDGSCVSATDP